MSAPYKRKAPTPKQVIASLLHQGVQMVCYRTREPITLANVNDLEREHIVELGLFATDEEKAAHDTPEYWRWSLSAAHAKVTNGNGATTLGSSKHIVAKAKRLERRRLEGGSAIREDAGANLLGVDKPPTKRKITSPGFDKTRTRRFDGKVVKRKPRRSA